ncbi:DNA polymerase III subunit delta [Candidatus Pelagibacter sp. HIMB1587]|uniref:DNA polymerase III subunit delta n=1 Tax=Candidatus Pelagibacter sp. HIMB1587 TaxID=3413354 RepID=UPI003F85991E
MIIKSFEANKIKTSKNNIILMYGRNEGLKRQLTEELSSNFNDIEIYEEKEILDNSNKFIENILNKSLFSNKQMFIIRRATDKIHKILEEINLKGISDTIIVHSDNLEKKSKLRSYFEKDKQLICIPFYPDNDQTLSKIAIEFFKKRNIFISQLNINQIVTKSLGDRGILYNELLKIENFSKSGKKLTDEIIKKLINLSENHSISELIDNCLEKNKIKLIKILNENIYSNDDCIIILRTLLTKSKKLLILSKEYEKNKNIDLTISTSKPPIFWKEKETTKRQIKSWKPQKLKLLIYKINELELIIKKNFNNSLNLLTDFLLAQSGSKTNN